MRCAKRRTATMVLCNCQLAQATLSPEAEPQLACPIFFICCLSWKAPCDRLGVFLERSMNVLRAESPIVYTQPRLRFAIRCRWRELVTHIHSPHLSCVLMGPLRRYRAGKVVSPVRCGCYLHPWYTVPWLEGFCPKWKTSPIVPPAL